MAMTYFVSRGLHGEPPFIYGDGTQTRDFTYVTDAKSVNDQLLIDDSADGEIINIGSTDNIDIRRLAEIVRNAIDPDLEIVHDDPRSADVVHTDADVSKANKLLGYEPSMDIREGVKRFIEWYRVNEEWYDPLVRNS